MLSTELLTSTKSHPCLPPPATQLFKLMDKYRPETKQAKKERLRERAAARFVVRLENVVELATK